MDVTKIDGYADMTAEEKIAALEAYEPEVKETTDVSKLKDALNKANSQAAEFKRALREKQSEAERVEAERAEKEKEMAELLDSYKQKERISSYKSKLLGVGYDAETADTMASSLPDGMTDEFFEAQKAFIEAQKREIETKIMKDQSELTSGSPLQKKNIEDPLISAFRRGAGL